MGQFTEAAQNAVQHHLDKGLPRVQAFHKVRTANFKAISDWYEHIESIHQRFGPDLPGEWANVIDSVQQAIAREREFIRNLDDLEKSDWTR